ncbi:unnamed protein product [Rangifer tarandus platyrhynchus]|uniref:Uncharacterized protein n=1 Tax=Rangifer tarandus platyrhynchus TaxID=3082113 RepID=A0AC59YBY9_RANTA
MRALLTWCVCAKSLQLCLTLCDPVDRSPPGSSIHGILQARILEWVALPLLQGIFPDPGIKPASLKSHALSGRLFTTSVTWEDPLMRPSKLNYILKAPPPNSTTLWVRASRYEFGKWGTQIFIHSSCSGKWILLRPVAWVGCAHGRRER